MQTTFICPHCKETIEITEALTHQIEQEVSVREQEKHARELATMKKQLEEAQAIELTLRKERNALSEEKRTFELEKQRQLDSEREKIRQKAIEEITESQRLREKEKDKVIDDLKRSLEEAQRKATQGSQQLQGEVQELDLEQSFALAFPGDVIEPVGKGVLGADIRHIVKSPRGMTCGVILWESKRTKAWSDSWITKLKEDLRNDKANIPAIISEVVPEAVKSGIGLVDGVWVALPKFVIPLAMLLRKSLLDAGLQRVIAENRQTKAESLYTFVTGHEFVQQVEAMIDIYIDMKDQIVRERTSFEKLWKQREMQVTRLLSGVSGMYGSIQGIAGSSLPPIKKLELDEA